MSRITRSKEVGLIVTFHLCQVARGGTTGAHCPIVAYLRSTRSKNIYMRIRFERGIGYKPASVERVCKKGSFMSKKGIWPVCQKKIVVPLENEVLPARSLKVREFVEQSS